MNATDIDRAEWTKALRQRDEARTEVRRLAAALRVCEYVLHRAEPTDEQLHAGQQASGAWTTDCTPTRLADDLDPETIREILGGPLRESSTPSPAPKAHPNEAAEVIVQHRIVAGGIGGIWMALGDGEAARQVAETATRGVSEWVLEQRELRIGPSVVVGRGGRTADVQP